MAEEAKSRNKSKENVNSTRSENRDDGHEGRFAYGLRAIPPILACTAGAYLLGLSGCLTEVSESLPKKLNFGYHLAAGAGLYGGYTNNNNRKITSLVALAASFTPEIITLVHDGDFGKIGAASAAKAVGYGVGYILGYFVNKNS